MATSVDYLGCVHYKRKCSLVAPCCNKTYTCRLCHDEDEKHPLNRHSVREVVCKMCRTRQRVQKICRNCGITFGKYFCRACTLYDDEFKGQYHCAPCGLCRVGGEENFFHCGTCNMCLGLSLLNGHKCIENRSRSDCPICMENLHTSRNELFLPKCGHFLHKTCLTKMEESGFTDCSLCKEKLHE